MRFGVLTGVIIGGVTAVMGVCAWLFSSAGATLEPPAREFAAGAGLRAVAAGDRGGGESDGAGGASMDSADRAAVDPRTAGHRADPGPRVAMGGEVPWAMPPMPAPELAGDDEPIALPWLPEPIKRENIREYCVSDFNRDDVIDDSDAAQFIEEWSYRDGPLAAMLDIDQDGWITDDDFSAYFVSLEDNCEPATYIASRARNSLFTRLELHVQLSDMQVNREARSGMLNLVIRHAQLQVDGK